MKYKLCILFYIVYVNFLIGQTGKIDSHKSIFEDKKEIDSIRFQAGLDAFMLLFRKNLDTARVFGNEVLKFSEEKNNIKWRATSLRFIGNTYAANRQITES